mgnify:FL=1
MEGFFPSLFHYREKNGRLTETDRKVWNILNKEKTACTAAAWTFSCPEEVAERMNRTSSLGLSGYAGLGLALLAKITGKEQADWWPLLDLIQKQ